MKKQKVYHHQDQPLSTESLLLITNIYLYRHCRELELTQALLAILLLDVHPTAATSRFILCKAA